MLSLLASIFLSCSVIAVGVWFYSNKMSRQLFQFNVESTSRQIAIILRQYDNIFNAFQIEMNREGRKAVMAIAREVGSNYRNLNAEQLKQIALRHGCDEIYFVNRNGKIVNSSFLPDLKLDLFATGIFFENFLRSVYGKGIVFTPQASVSMKTGIVNKYIYYSPEESDYIVEISYNLKRYVSRRYSTNYYEFLSLRKISELAVGNELLINIDLINSSESGRCWSLLTPGRELMIPKRIIQETMTHGRLTVINGDIMTLYLDVSQTTDRFDIYDATLNIAPRLLILTYNLNAINQYGHNLLLFLITAVIISAAICFLIFSEYFSRKFIRRILTINNGLQNIARGRYDTNLDVPGNDELTLIARNISKMTAEIRTREEDLRRSEKRFRSIFEHAPLGIIIIGLDRRIRYFNSAFLKMLQYTNEELIDHDFLPLIAKEELSKSIRSFTSVVKGEVDSYVTDRRLICKDGTSILAALTVAAIRDDNNIPSYIIAIINDITERHQIQQQFFQAQKLDAIGKLAGGIAHDFNNLLQVIMGYSKMLEKYLHEPKALELWSNVVQAGDKARNLVRQLLAFGRYNPITENRNIDLNLMMQDFVKMLSRVLGENIELKINPAENLPLINADQGQIEQVLMNLCVNARDAMSNGGTLTITNVKRYISEEKARQYPDLKAGFFAGFAINDTGCGMSEDVKKHIFEPFFTTKPVGQGTGIGLATVYAIVKNHGGVIELDSTIDVGTTFLVLFPTSEGFAVEEQRHEESSDPKERYPGRGELILICEDEQQVRMLAEMILTESGYRVVSAQDGEEGIELFNRHMTEISLVMLDVIMPKMSGRQVFRHIRTITRTMPVLFTTGYSQEMLGEEFGNSVIQKPYDEAILLKKAREMIDEDRQP